jgi:hypothetical protein
MVGRDVQNHGNAGMKLFRALQAESSKLQAPTRSCPCSGRSAKPPARRCCRPPAWDPAFSRISPTSAVVVVLPFEPVMASVLPLRKRAASSSSPMTGRPKALHLRQLRRIQRHAGADDDQILAAEGQQAVAAGLDHDALSSSAGISLASAGAAHVGDRNLRAALAQKQRRRQAGFAQPTTRTFLPFSSISPLFPASGGARSYLPLCTAKTLCAPRSNAVSAW